MRNPVLRKELKTTSRSWRLMGLITFACSILALILMGYLTIAYGNDYSLGGIEVEELMGLYFTLVGFVIVLIGFIAPATTAGAIAGEKQRRTFDLLLCTKLSSFKIATGKLSASLVKTVMILIVSFPMFAMITIFGGVSISKIALTFLFILNLAIYFGAIGLFTSSIMKRPVSATILAYVIMGLMAFGTLLLIQIIVELTGGYGTSSMNWLSYLYYISPLSGFMSLIEYQVGYGGSLIPDAVIQTFPKVLRDLPLRDFYINGAHNILVSCGLLLWTMRNINPIKKKFSFKRKGKNNAKAAEVVKEVATETAKG